MPRSERVLVVDDYEPNLRGLRGLLEHARYDVTVATTGAEALRLVQEQPPDVILLDVMMPGVSGIEVCAALKQNPSTHLIPIVLVSGAQERALRVAGLEAGADDFLDKPVDPGELYARVAALLRVKRLTDDLESAESLFRAMARIIEARDACTEGHCDRLTAYATALGRRLALDVTDLDALARGAYLHDIGKIAIPDRVLLKRGRLTKAEYALMQRHPVIGDELCATVRSLEAVRPIVRHHHERLDGRGYPDGLAGDAVPLLAFVVAVVDVFDALTTDRPYRRALPVATAYAMLRQEVKGGWCPPELVETFIELHASGAAVVRPAAEVRETVPLVPRPRPAAPFQSVTTGGRADRYTVPL